LCFSFLVGTTSGMAAFNLRVTLGITEKLAVILLNGAWC
jgi:hypothetical protein